MAEKELCSADEAALFGLLSVHWDASFGGSTGARTGGPWLVLHLDLVRAPTQPAYVAAIHAALAAVGSLCGRHDVDTVDFWARVLTSSMMRTPVDDGPPTSQASEIARWVRAQGLKLLLSWEDRPFQATVATSIGSFMETPRTGDRTSPIAVGLGLRVARCGLTATALRLSHAVFQRLETSDPASLVMDPEALHRLDLSDNVLGPAELQAMAELLETPTSRYVRELVLERTVPPGASSEPLDCPALQRLVAAAGKASPEGAGDPGLSLSLAHNGLHEAHFKALHAGLVVSSRKLRELNLESVSTSSDGWAALAPLLFTNVSAMDGCDLNISRLQHIAVLTPALLAGLTALVIESIPVIQRALESNTQVRCRVFDPVLKPPVTSFMQARKARGKAEKTALVRPDLALYEVVAVDETNLRFQIPSAIASKPPQWISAASLASVMIGETEIIGSTGVTGLTIDSRIEHDALVYCTDLTVARLMPVMGPRLRSFRFRGRADECTPPGAVLLWCPQLEVLDVAEWEKYRPKWLWRDLDPATFCSLHTVRIRFGDVGESDMVALQHWLESGASERLQRLTLECCSIRSRALDVLAEIVETLPERVHLEVDWKRNPHDTDAADAIAVIDARLGKDRFLNESHSE